jgi:hypothetical protein
MTLWEPSRPVAGPEHVSRSGMAGGTCGTILLGCVQGCGRAESEDKTPGAWVPPPQLQVAGPIGFGSIINWVHPARARPEP